MHYLKSGLNFLKIIRKIPDLKKMIHLFLQIVPAFMALENQPFVSKCLPSQLKPIFPKASKSDISMLTDLP
jgi:hypothetical protein